LLTIILYIAELSNFFDSCPVLVSFTQAPSIGSTPPIELIKVKELESLAGTLLFGFLLPIGSLLGPSCLVLGRGTFATDVLVRSSINLFLGTGPETRAFSIEDLRHQRATSGETT
jgi:hypothetical protein